MAPLSVAFVDEHPVLLAGLDRWFSGKADFKVVALGSSARDAMEIAAKYAPDVLVVEIVMSGDIFDAIAEIIGKTQTKVVAFTAANGIEQAVRALDAGATGFILKGSMEEELMEGIRAVHGGETFITPSFASKVIVALRNASLRRVTAQAIKLSIREEQIVRLLLRGQTNKEIAQSLSISDKTVKHYMTVLMQKLQARNRIEVVLAAQKLDMAAQQERSAPLWRH